MGVFPFARVVERTFHDSAKTIAMQKADGLKIPYFGCVVSVCFELFASTARAGGCLEGGCDGCPYGASEK